MVRERVESLARDDFVVTENRRYLLGNVLQLAVLTVVAIWLAGRSEDLGLWLCVVVFGRALVVLLVRGNWLGRPALAVTHDGIVIRGGPAIPWADIEDIGIGESGRFRKTLALLIWVRPSGGYYTRRSFAGSAVRLGRRLMPSFPTLTVSGKRLNTSVERVLAEIQSRSGSPWSGPRGQSLPR